MSARLPDAYFDEIYAGDDDPWQLSTRWYEQGKYGITLAMLPNPHYRHAFEPGCSIGTLTALLVQRCDHVLGRVSDRDFVVEVFDGGDARSVAAREVVPGSR